ncbi:hypothetical protein ACW73L_07550 [Methylolobus aquaticus]
MGALYIDHGTHLRRLSDGALIPKEPENRDFALAQEALTVDAAAWAAPADLADMDATRATALVAIDAAAEGARLRYITPGAGQAQTYAQKLAQAEAYVAAGAPPDASPWPFIAGEAEALEISPQAAAATIITTAEAWVTVGVAIERTRMAGKRAVTIASGLAQLAAARDAAITTLEAL